MNSKNKKILFIMHVPPPIHGAAIVGKYIKESKIINSTFKTHYVTLGTAARIDNNLFDKIRKIFKFFSVWFKAVYKSILITPDITYLTLTSNGIGFYKDFIIAISVRPFSKKMIYHFHNKGVKDNSSQTFNDLLYKVVFRNSEVILLSDKLYYDIEKYVNKDKVHICPNGIPEQINQNLILKNENRIPNILFLSNLIESKGLFTLLDALAKIQVKGLDFKCFIVGGEGDITKSKLLRKIDKFNLSNKVHYLGKKYDNEKNEIFIKSDIFVFPSFYHNECFPLVLLEAMQFGLPIISTYEGGIMDIVENGENGFLVKQKSVEELTDKIETLLKNKNLRSKMGENGKYKYNKSFTLKKFEENLVKILK